MDLISSLTDQLDSRYNKKEKLDEFRFMNKKLESLNNKIAKQMVENSQYLLNLKKIHQECINNFYIISKNINNNSINNDF